MILKEADFTSSGRRDLRARQDLIDGLWHLRALAIRLELKVVAALIKAAIGMIPTSMH